MSGCVAFPVLFESACIQSGLLKSGPLAELLDGTTRQHSVPCFGKLLCPGDLRAVVLLSAEDISAVAT